MKNILITIILITISYSGYSQDSDNSSDTKSGSNSDIRKNSVYLDYRFIYLSAIYERHIILKDKISFSVGGGISQGVAFTSATNPILKSALIFGKKKHCFELGAFSAPLQNDLTLLMPVAGYRFQSKKGFLFQIEIVFITDEDTDNYTGTTTTKIVPFPGIGFGYSF